MKLACFSRSLLTYAASWASYQIQGARKGPVGRAFARHVAIGMGLSDEDLVLLNLDGRPYVFHFGGSAFESMLVAMAPGLEPMAGLNGIVLRGILHTEKLQDEAAIELVEKTAYLRVQGMAGMFALGPFHKMLPAELQVETILKLFSPKEFCDWVRSRNEMVVTESDAIFGLLAGVLTEGKG